MAIEIPKEIEGRGGDRFRVSLKNSTNSQALTLTITLTESVTRSSVIPLEALTYHDLQSRPSGLPHASTVQSGDVRGLTLFPNTFHG